MYCRVKLTVFAQQDTRQDARDKTATVVLLSPCELVYDIQSACGWSVCLDRFSADEKTTSSMLLC